MLTFLSSPVAHGRNYAGLNKEKCRVIVGELIIAIGTYLNNRSPQSSLDDPLINIVFRTSHVCVVVQIFKTSFF
jgi:hypothetical protein